jgi:hypothetical protein
MSTTTDLRICEAILYRQTRINPAEYCDNAAEDGSDYCTDHWQGDQPYEPEYDPTDMWSD